MKDRVLSGMRPTGALHLGHYHGALKNWVRLQSEMECYYFVADWHALTTHYESREVIEQNVYEMVIDWLAVGLNPNQCTMFLQSRIPEHAELFTLLAMGTPLGWLERVPTYKDQQEKLKDKDLATYGFLGYPLLQAADILIYKAHFVPVGEDQASHVELTREAARRFNHLYGRERNAEQRIAASLAKLPRDSAKRFEKSRKQYQETGDTKALDGTMAYIAQAPELDADDRERLSGHFKGTGRSVLIEPQVLLTPTSRLHVAGSVAIDSPNIPLIFNETDQTGNGKYWRMVLDSKIRTSLQIWLLMLRALLLALSRCSAVKSSESKGSIQI